MGVKPGQMGREPRRPGRDRQPGRRRAQIKAAPRIGERCDPESKQQNDRPILSEHGGGRGKSCQHRIGRTTCRKGAQEQPRGQRPQRRHHRVGVELEGVKIIERHQGEQGQTGDALFAAEIGFRCLPGNPQRRRRQQDGEQIVGPVRERKHAEPSPHQPSRQGRMLGRAERHLARPGDHLAHVEMDVLTALGDGAIDRPDRCVSGEQRQNGAFPARGIEKGFEQALEP